MRSALVLAALLSVAEATINYCGAKMCGRTNEHTFCKYHGPSPNCMGYMEDRLTHDERARVLARLNRRRGEAARGRLRLPAAGNMLRLRWVEELAREAQLWADQCQPPGAPEAHDDCRDLFSITVGQCVASVVGEAPGLRPESMVDTWYLQGLQYKGNVTSYTSSPKHADFGQMVWAHSFMVGCARSRFMSEINDRTRTVIRLVCNFAPRGPAGELWLPASPAAACPQHTEPDTELPGLCAQLNDTSRNNPSNKLTIEEQTVLNAVLEIERNKSLEHHGSLDEIYLTNMAIATLNQPATTESYSKVKQKQNVLKPILLDDAKEIDQAQNSIEDIDEIISKLVREKTPHKTTKLVKKVSLSIVGRPKSYEIEELSDQEKEGNTVTRPVETTTVTEKDLYAEYELQDVTETNEYDDKATTLRKVVAPTSTFISAVTLSSTEDVPSTRTPRAPDKTLKDIPSVKSPSAFHFNAVADKRIEEANVTNHDLLRLLALSKMNEAYPSDPQTAMELQQALEHVEKTLAGETSAKVRRELRRRPSNPAPQDDSSQDYGSPEESSDQERLQGARRDPQDPEPPASPIRTLDKTPTLNMIIKYLPFMKEYEKMMSPSANNSSCVVMIFVSVCVSLGLF